MDITKGVKVIPKPEVVNIRFEDLQGSTQCWLDAWTNGDLTSHCISKAVAEVLIAQGYSYGS